MGKKKDQKKNTEKFRYKVAYYDETGKRRGKTFTGADEDEARAKAYAWKKYRDEGERPNLTVLECVEGYIQTKEGVLSPATICGYESVKRSIEGSRIANIPIGKLTNFDVQAWINEGYMKKKSPKTLSNWYGLLEPSVLMYDKSFKFDITLPQKEKYSGHTPSDEEVKALLDYCKKKDRRDLYIAILLAAFGPMRRGEICALTSDDIKGNLISITKDKVKDKDGAWVVKTTKTTESNRVLEFPYFVIKELKGIEGDIIKCNPDQLHHRFRRAIKFSKSPFFRFHDLRHYSASIMHALGVPDVYIRQRGGWASDHVMKKIYIDAMEKEQKKQTAKINKHFKSVVRL